MKTFAIVLGAVAAVLVIAVIVFTLSLGSIIKKGVETFGPKAAGVPITLEKVRVSLLSGTARIEGLVVGNPEGFAAPYAFKMDNLALDIDLRSLKTDTIVIRKVHINGPEIVLEQSLKANNIRQIQKNISSGAAAKNKTDSAKESDAAEKEQTKREKAEKEKKIVIEDFLLENGKVTLRLKVLKEQTKEINLADIHLKDIGKASGGATAADAIFQVLAAVSGALVDASLDAGQQVGKLTDVIGGEVGTAVDQAGPAAKEGASKVVGGLKGLFKKEEK